MPPDGLDTTPRTIVPEGILLHRCESGSTGEEVKRVEAAQGFGYHYFVGRDGRESQLYPDEFFVWHARTWSHHCLAIALHGDFDPREGSVNDQPTPEQLAALEKLLVRLWVVWGPLPIYGHTDLPHATHDPDKRCPGPNLDVPAIARSVFIQYCSRWGLVRESGPTATPEVASAEGQTPGA